MTAQRCEQIELLPLDTKLDDFLKFKFERIGKQLAEVIDPDATTDPSGHAAVRQAVARSVGSDIGAIFTEAVRLRANPTINQKTLDQIVQP